MAKTSRNERTQQVLTPVAVKLTGLDSDQAEIADIERLAYGFWLERGSPIGSPEEDWFRAETELRAGRQKSVTT